MNPPFYEIDASTETLLRSTIESGGAVLQRRRNLKKTAEAEEQYWSVTVNNEEVFWFSIAVENTGRRLLVMGPKRESLHSYLYDSVISAAEKSGAKRLEKL
jgi:hypothetical protein